MASLFYDDEFQALRSVIETGKGYKASACFLWPEMKPESAYAKLKSCTNPNGDQRLSGGQCIALSKFNDRDDWLAWACDEGGYERPKKASLQDKQAELMQAFAAAVEQSKAIAAQLERLVTK